MELRPFDGPGFVARLGELLGAYDPDVVAVQLNLIGSHDTPRALTVLGGDVAAIRMATLLQCTLPGAPSIYYGDEIGLTGGNDPACRGAFPWDPARWDSGLLSYVRSVLRLRAAEPALRHGSTTAIGAVGAAIAFERRLGGDRLVIALNPGIDAVSLDVTLDGVGDGTLDSVELVGIEPGGGSEAVAGPAAVVDGAARLVVPPRAGQVLRLIG
jgi:neopullulanase